VARQLVEQEHVLLLFSPLGTPTNLAIRGYMNERKVPQLFIISGVATLNDPEHFPWSMPSLPSYHFEGSIYGRYISKNLPDAKIAILYQNDDFRKDKLLGLREGLGEKADKPIVATQSYETTDPTSTRKYCRCTQAAPMCYSRWPSPNSTPQAIRKVYDIGWKPMQFADIGVQSLKDGDPAGGTREGGGPHIGDPRQVSDRPAVVRRSRVQGVAGVDEEIQSVRRYLG
jgi:branched-chain amino acid transport system substrate-binding protein